MALVVVSVDEQGWGSFLDWLEEQYGDSFFTDNDDEAAYVSGQCVATYDFTEEEVTVHNGSVWSAYRKEQREQE